MEVLLSKSDLCHRCGCAALLLIAFILPSCSSLSPRSKLDPGPDSRGVRGLGSNRDRNGDERFADPESEPEGLKKLAPDRLDDSLMKLMGKGPNRNRAEDLYEQANELFAKAESQRENGEITEKAQDTYAAAGKLYMSAAKAFPSSALEHDALYQAGEAYFFADLYPKANTAYEKLIAKYSGTHYLDKVEARRFAIAKYWLELHREDPDSILIYDAFAKIRPKYDTDGHALRIYDKIRVDDPTGRLADDATMALANAYFAKGRYNDAADTYEDLRTSFPNSQHQFNAHLLEIKSRLVGYQGPEYDGTGLIKAEKVMKAIITQFPREVDANRQQLEEMAGEIRYLMAEREMAMAVLYDRREEYRAARLYYETVIEEYQDTKLAVEAEKRLSEIAGSPDVPPQKAEWLIDVLPKPRNEKPLFGTAMQDK